MRQMGSGAAQAGPALVRLYREDEDLKGAILNVLYGMREKACVAKPLYEEVLRSPDTNGVERREAEAALANLRGCGLEK